MPIKGTFFSSVSNSSFLSIIDLSLFSSLVVLFFSAEWSDESKLMGEVVMELLKSEKVTRTAKFLQLEAEEYEEISMNYDVEAVPTFVFIRVCLKQFK